MGLSKYLAVLLAILAGTAAATSVLRPAHADERPNVLFLMCDDLNCDLGCYGHPQVRTPNLDRLAARGVRFNQSFCQYPLCGPSRASLMTGMYPDQTLIHDNWIYIRQTVPNVKSMSQMFQDNGYFATRIGKIYHYGVPGHIGTSGHDDPYSWDYTINPRGRDKDDEPLIFSLKPKSYGASLSWLAADGEDEEQTDGIGATDAINQLKQYSRTGKRFFLGFGLYRPHTPYVSPKKYFALYPPEKIPVPQVPEGYLQTLPEPAQKFVLGYPEERNLPPEVARQAIQAYHAAISFADAQLGRVLDALQSLGLEKNTIVVFTSDHGYHMGEHGHWQKRSLFANGSRVPLIIAGPGVTAAGQSTNSPAELVDLFPTLAELCSLNVPQTAVGVSLVPALKDPMAMPRESALSQLGTGYSIVFGDYRYTEWGPDGKNGNELYDHRTDPEEMVNRADDPACRDVVEKLSGHLHERIRQARAVPKGLKQVLLP